MNLLSAVLYPEGIKVVEVQVIIFCKAERAVKKLPMNRNVHVDDRLLAKLYNYLGENCVKVIDDTVIIKLGEK